MSAYSPRTARTAAAYRIANDKVLAFNPSGGGPRCGGSGLHELGRLTFQFRVFLNSLDGDLGKRSMSGGAWIWDRHRTIACSRPTNRRTINSRSMVIVEANDRAKPASAASMYEKTEVKATQPMTKLERTLKREEIHRFTAKIRFMIPVV